MEIIQYSIIILLTLIAVIFLVKKLRNAFKGDCTSGDCGCSDKLSGTKK